MDLSVHLTEPVQVSQGQYAQNYGVSRECIDTEGWRLTYDWDNPFFDNDKVGRLFGTTGGGKAYAFVAETARGYDIHYFVYYVYNFGNPILTSYDHWGDWERATVHLEWINGALEPTGYTTEGHGNLWYNSWSSGEVWLNGDHPDAFVADGSHGTYPNTAHERGILDFPQVDSTNRTCVDGHLGVFCDFIAGDGPSAQLPVQTILVDGLYDPAGVSFRALDSLGAVMPNQPNWLQTDYACQGAGGPDGPIYWWGNNTHDGGPRTPLNKGNMPWAGKGLIIAGNTLFLSLSGSSEPLEEVTVQAEDSIFLDLQRRFEDLAVGGAINLVFDPEILQVADVTFNNGDDRDYRCPTDPTALQPVPCPTDETFISFGSRDGISRSGVVATIEFRVLASGTTSIGFDVASPFSDVFGDPLTLPEPRFGLWAGLVALAVLNRLRQRRRSGATKRACT
jgi:hypothetical protein